MNKPQYLAELSQLLIFMTRADREKTLGRYGALFDAAGPEGQQALLEKLGSTTRQAIRLSRIYDADGYEDELLDALEAQAPAAPTPEAEAAPETEAEQLAARIREDLPQFDLDDLPDLAALPDEPAPAPEPEPEPAPERKPEAAKEPEQKPEAEKSAPEQTAPAKPAADPAYEELWGKRPEPAKPAEASAPGPEPVPADAPEEEPRQAPAPAAPQTFQAVERVIPLWAGLPLFLLSVIFLVLPLVLLGLLLIPALLIPGAVILLGAFLAVIGGLWCISIIADAAVLFGAALILLALGLIVLWLGLWTDVAMVTGFSKALLGLADLTLGKKVTIHA